MRRNRYINQKKDTTKKLTGFFKVVMLVSIGFGSVIGVFESYKYLTRTNFMPITAFQVEGSVQYSDMGEIKSRLMNLPKMGFFNADIDLIKNRIEDLRWIKRANVKRSWPDKISIEILEYKPVAIWNGRYFITPEGELIEISGDEEYAQSLNQLYGPVGDHVLVMNTYIQLADKLHKNEIYIHKLKLNGRRSIELVLEDDVLIIVGRDNVQSRIDRLINYYDALKAQRVKPIGKIDLRYTNGFSVASNV